MIRLRPITEKQTHAIILRQLTGGEACDQVAEDCALLRTCAWALTDGIRPVHVLRLLNLASTLQYSGDSSRSRLKDALSELSECGDLAELSHGQWLPAPAREVPLGTSDDLRLLVGGFPTSLLPEGRRSSIQHTGPFRRFWGDTLSKEFGLQSQSLDAWMGEVPQNLMAWTRSALEGVYDRFRPSGRPIEIYAPELFASAKPQAFRWVSRVEKLAGSYLAREELPFCTKRHLAVNVEQGEITEIKTLPSMDFRRLMYGLDVLADKPVSVEENRGHGKVSFLLRSELPQAEQRLFAALGRLMVPDGAYYPRTWTFDEKHAARIKARLEDLGVNTFTKAHK